LKFEREKIITEKILISNKINAVNGFHEIVKTSLSSDKVEFNLIFDN